MNEVDTTQKSSTGKNVVVAAIVIGALALVGHAADSHNHSSGSSTSYQTGSTGSGSGDGGWSGGSDQTYPDSSLKDDWNANNYVDGGGLYLPNP